MKKILTILITFFLLVIPTTALAKGVFSYITIKGPDIGGDLSVTDPLMLDYFAFADFGKGKVAEPSNTGVGYEIVRSFVDGETNKVQNWDLLHYYPDTGYVYYNGLINGSSEYDKQWYIARPEMESKFRAVLAETARLTWIPYAALIVMLIIFAVAYNRRAKQKAQSTLVSTKGGETPPLLDQS